MSKNTFEVDTSLDITDRVVMQKILRNALTCYAEFGHVNNNEATQEELDLAQRLGSKYSGGITVSDCYYKKKSSDLSLIFEELEKAVKGEHNSSADKLDILERVTTPHLYKWYKWMGYPMWSMKGKVVSKDGLYKIEHDKDIDSSG
jgi:hypothetical protein